MGELEKEKGVWGYVEGGMGGVSQAMARAARSHGVEIFTEKVMFLWIMMIYCVIYEFTVFISNF